MSSTSITKMRMKTTTPQWTVLIAATEAANASGSVRITVVAVLTSDTRTTMAFTT